MVVTTLVVFCFFVDVTLVVVRLAFELLCPFAVFFDPGLFVVVVFDPLSLDFGVFGPISFSPSIDPFE